MTGEKGETRNKHDAGRQLPHRVDLYKPIINKKKLNERRKKGKEDCEVDCLEKEGATHTHTHALRTKTIAGSKGLLVTRSEDCASPSRVYRVRVNLEPASPASEEHV